MMFIQADWFSGNSGPLWDNNNACAAGGVDVSCSFNPPPPPRFQHFQQIPSFHLGLNPQLDKQKWDTDRFICLQNERLRVALLKQRKEQLGLILRKCEAKTQALLKQKDGEIAAAMNRTAELEALLKRLESENKAWEMAAMEREAAVACLKSRFQQVMRANALEAASSFCGDRTGDGGGGRHDDDDHVRLPPDTGKMVCKSCKLRSSCVVFLPCRHLCSCQPCEGFLDSCPLCKVTKKSTIQALI